MQCAMCIRLLTPTVTAGHFGGYFLSTRRGPQVVPPHPATLKINVAGWPGGPGGDPGGPISAPPGPPRTPKNEEIGYFTVTVAEINPKCACMAWPNIEDEC